MCRVLKVSRSGYYAWRNRSPSRRSAENEQLLDTIRSIHERSYGTYGSPRVHAELRLEHSVSCSRARVERLMRLHGLQGVHRRRARRRNGMRVLHPIFDDLVARDFTADAPNRLWVADITQHWTLEGWLYLAVVLDAFSRPIVGWAMSERATSQLVVSALEMALHNRQPDTRVVHHSDQGTQYTALTFGRHLSKSGVLGSMGAVGSALDNAMAESFFASLQTELLDRQVWPTRDSLKSAIFEYIEIFYNRRRRHSALNYLSPLEHETVMLSLSEPADDRLLAVH